MAFERPGFESFYRLIKETSRHPDIRKRCIAENFILEERLTEEREDNYGKHFEKPVNEETWDDGHEDYVYKRIYSSSGIPETFEDINKPNLLPAFDSDQYLVRLEDIGRLNRLYAKTAVEIMKHFSDFLKDPETLESANIIKSFFSAWNKKRDYRPIFAGFWGDVKDIFTDAAGNRVENEDWADRLRNRFGLGHMDPKDGEPIPVLMFRYRVRDVIECHTDEPNLFAVPTVLDGRFSYYFCPTPGKGWNHGQVLDLSTGDENNYSLYCEILHRFIEYKPEFLYKAGWITRSPGKTLENARRIHLEYLKDEFGNRI